MSEPAIFVPPGTSKKTLRSIKLALAREEKAKAKQAAREAKWEAQRLEKEKKRQAALTAYVDTGNLWRRAQAHACNVLNVTDAERKRRDEALDRVRRAHMTARSDCARRHKVPVSTLFNVSQVPGDAWARWVEHGLVTALRLDAKK